MHIGKKTKQKSIWFIIIIIFFEYSRKSPFKYNSTLLLLLFFFLMFQIHVFHLVFILFEFFFLFKKLAWIIIIIIIIMPEKKKWNVMKCLQSWPVKLWQNINERERNIDRYRTFFFCFISGNDRRNKKIDGFQQDDHSERTNDDDVKSKF